MFEKENIMFLKKIYFIIFSFFFIGCGADYMRDVNGSYIHLNLGVKAKIGTKLNLTFLPLKNH